MRIYTENIVPISEVVENIYALFGYELKECKKVELELRANVGVKKYLLDDIFKKLSHEAINSSNCKIFYINKKIPNAMCEYRIKLFDKESLC